MGFEMQRTHREDNAPHGTSSIYLTIPMPGTSSQYCSHFPTRNLKSVDLSQLSKVVHPLQAMDVCGKEKTLLLSLMG